MNYFRITGYCPEEDYSFIADSNGKFEKLWQFSSALIQNGIKIIEVSSMEKIIDINIDKAKQDAEHLILRAIAEGKSKYVQQEIDGITYKAIKVADKVYIPDNNQTI